MSIMLKEISEGGRAIEDTIVSVQNNLKLAGDMISQSEYVIITGSGTSYHSGLSLQISLLLKEIPAIPVKAPDFTNYIPEKFSKRVAVIIISQSGESSDALRALKLAKENGAHTIGITNEEKSALAEGSDIALVTSAGHEEAIAATKSYVSQLTAIEMLRGVLNNGDTRDELKSVSKWYRETTSNSESFRSIAEGLADKLVFLGDGYLFTTAMESALKFKETCNLSTEAYQVREYLHGPIQTLDSGTTVLLFRPRSEIYLEVMNELKKYTDKVLIVGPDEDDDIKIMSVKRFLRPLAYILPIQLMAYYKALSLNLNPDKPEKLSKVVK